MKSLEIDPFNLIIIIAAAQGIVFSMVTHKRDFKDKKTLNYLILTILFLSLNNLQYWVRDIGLTKEFPFAHHLLIPWYFLILPNFYKFLRSYIHAQAYLPSFNLLTYGFFYLGTCLRVIFLSYFLLVETSEADVFLKSFNLYEETISMVYSLFLFIYSIFLLKQKKGWGNFVLAYDDLSWVRVFFSYGAAVLVLWILAIFQNYYLKLWRPPESYYPVRLGTSLLIYWTGYRGLFKFKLLQERIKLRSTLNPLNKFQSKPQSDTNKKSLYKSLIKIIAEDRGFLDANLSLDSLAQQLNVSATHLSHVINKELGTNLTDFVNQLRIDHAKKLLNDSGYQHYTILAIGLESGFNSKSTFYAAFKKYTSLSPLQYKQDIQKS